VVAVGSSQPDHGLSVSAARTQAIVDLPERLWAEETVEPCGEAKPLLMSGKIDQTHCPKANKPDTAILGPIPSP
jgi:hypothetical protein